MLSRSRLALAAALAFTVCASRDASAQVCQPADGVSACVPADNSWPHLGADHFHSLGPTSSIAADGVALGLVASYLHRPIALVAPSADPEGRRIEAVAHVIRTNILLGIGVTDRLTLMAGLPLNLWQDGAGAEPLSGKTTSLVRSSVGDLRFGVRFAAVARPSGQSGFGLMARFEAAAPTGDQLGFNGAAGGTFAPGASATYRIGRFTLGADVAARVRPSTRVGTVQIGSQLSTGLGATFDVIEDDWLRAGLEVNALLPLVFPDDADNHLPAEWHIRASTARLVCDRSVRAAIGLGSLIPTGPDTAVTAPALRVVASIQYAPR